MTAPTLLVVGSHDPVVIDLNRRALAELVCEARLEIVEGATHLFEEPGTLEQAATLATGQRAHLLLLIGALEVKAPDVSARSNLVAPDSENVRSTRDFFPDRFVGT